MARALKAEEKLGMALAENPSDDLLMTVVGYLYGLQTMVEQSEGITIEKNTIGFTKDDAPRLSPIGLKVYSGDRFLTDDERETLVSKRHGLHKYWAQLRSLAVEPIGGGFQDDPPRRRKNIHPVRRQPVK